MRALEKGENVRYAHGETERDRRRESERVRRIDTLEMMYNLTSHAEVFLCSISFYILAVP